MMRAVINSVLASNTANYHCGAQKLFLDNRYDCPELFVILFEEMKLIGSRTCRKNTIYFPVNDELLIFSKGAERGTYRWLYNRCFYFESTRCKDSKTLKFIISYRKTGIIDVLRRRGKGIHQVFFPEDLTKYHQNIDGVGRGEIC